MNMKFFDKGARVAMVGDSITHRWEGDGKAIWEKEAETSGQLQPERGAAGGGGCLVFYPQTQQAFTGYGKGGLEFRSRKAGCPCSGG